MVSSFGTSIPETRKPRPHAVAGAVPVVMLLNSAHRARLASAADGDSAQAQQEQ